MPTDANLPSPPIHPPFRVIAERGDGVRQVLTVHAPDESAAAAAATAAHPELRVLLAYPGTLSKRQVARLLRQRRASLEIASARQRAKLACLRCGYSFEGLPNAPEGRRCPECGFDNDHVFAAAVLPSARLLNDIGVGMSWGAIALFCFPLGALVFAAVGAGLGIVAYRQSRGLTGKAALWWALAAVLVSGSIWLFVLLL